VEEVADEWFEEKIPEGELIRSFDEDGNEVLKFNEEHPKYKRRQRRTGATRRRRRGPPGPGLRRLPRTPLGRSSQDSSSRTLGE
jgi:hypothetical protein